MTLQLDKTRITVRERNCFEILDLALRVTRVYARVLVPALAAGVVPMMALNYWLLAGYREVDWKTGYPTQYIMLTVLLVAWEAPLATAPATLCLGQVLFAERPHVGTVLRHFGGSLGQLVIYQVLLRPLHLDRPYLNEVILLERNPMWRKSSSGTSTLRRSRALHRGEGGLLFARWLMAVALATLLVVSIWVSILIVATVLVGSWDWEMDGPAGAFGFPMSWWVKFYFPLSLWIVVGYLTVVRFLSYLDLRIRREGWEVELAMRAEEARLTRKLR